MNNLHQIAMACQSYATENGGRFPDGLQQLYPAFVDNSKTFSCPSQSSNYRDFENGSATERSSSYTLIPGLLAAMPEDFILAFDKSPDNHQGKGRNVAFLGARVEWWPADRTAEFQKRLTEQRKKVRNWKPESRREPPVE